MPAPTHSDSVCEKFRSSVVSSYELDAEVVESLCKFVREALEACPVPPTVAKRRAPRAKASAVSTTDSVNSSVTVETNVSKKPRNKSGYNLYVQKMMHDETVKSLKHTEKMAEIGRRWKLLSDTEKDQYNALAVEANNASETASVATATA